LECVEKSVDSGIALINLTKMAEIYKVATLNINGMSAGGIVGMLNEFIHKQEIDINLLQEVSHTDF